MATEGFLTLYNEYYSKCADIFRKHPDLLIHLVLRKKGKTDDLQKRINTTFSITLSKDKIETTLGYRRSTLDTLNELQNVICNRYAFERTREHMKQN
ncbi:MAG: hypothetical protein J6Y07_01555 [Alphaproteobacteria bacterium]|nr:hypothetical protein [Alphaproteobacteria bacterium]